MSRTCSRASPACRLKQAAISTEWIRGYFDRAIADREQEPGRNSETDFISRLLVSELGGEPMPREDIISICYTAMLAGLDTTRSALGYIFHHLALDPELRHRLTAQPQPRPKAVEGVSCASTLLGSPRTAA